MTRRRDFGLIKAIIDDDERRVVLAFASRKAGKLDDGVRRRCVEWALKRLKPLADAGYVIDSRQVSGVS